MRWFFLILLVVALAAGLRWSRTPERSFKSAVKAAEEKNLDQFDRYVDLPAVTRQVNAVYAEEAGKIGDLPAEFKSTPFAMTVGSPQGEIHFREAVATRTYLANPLEAAGPDFLRTRFQSIDSVERIGESAIVHTTFLRPNGRPFELGFRMEPTGWHWHVTAITNAAPIIRAELESARKELVAREQAAAEAAAAERKRLAAEASDKLHQMIVDYNTGTVATTTAP